MTTNQNSQSSFGTIIFTTNIPGDKEYTLDPTNISYSDEPDSKITNTTNKVYFFNDKIINNNFFSNLTKTNILSIIFNKKRFDKLASTKDDNDNSSKLDEREIITSNIMSYIENIFTTFPKSYNIKNINNINNMGSLKFSLPYSSIPYTYLNIDGTPHTVSRVVYYDDKQNDKISIEMINYYNEFDKWYPNEKKLFKVFTTPLLKDFNKLFDSKMTKNNLYNTFGKNETNNQEDFGETIKKYENYIERINKYKEASENTPSYNWEQGKFEVEFFEETTKNKYQLLSEETPIMEKINEFLKNVTDNALKKKIEGIINNFKDKVNEESLLGVNGTLKKSPPKFVIAFQGLVKTLHDDINKVLIEYKSGSKIELWVDFEEASDKKGIKPPDKFSTQDLSDQLKKSQKHIEDVRTEEKVYKTYNDNDDGSQIIAKMLSNVSDYRFTGTIANARIDKEINDFEVAVKSIFANYKILFNLNEKYNIAENITTDSFDEAYKASRIITDQLKQIKKPVGMSSSLFPSHKFKDILVLLESFIIHYDIYSKFSKKIYDPELILDKYSRYNEYKQYIDFIKKISKYYEYKDEFELEKLQKMIRDGDLVKVRNDVGFENESIRLHIDLIKGKVDDTNVKQIECKYKDNDLVERWNKLDEIKDDSIKLEPMYYFKIDDTKSKDPKQIKKGGKKTRKRRRKKYVYTRKR